MGSNTSFFKYNFLEIFINTSFKILTYEGN